MSSPKQGFVNVFGVSSHDVPVSLTFLGVLVPWVGRTGDVLSTPSYRFPSRSGPGAGD